MVPELGMGLGARGAGQPRTEFPGVLLPRDIAGVFSSGHRCRDAGSLGTCLGLCRLCHPLPRSVRCHPGWCREQVGLQKAG